MAGKFNKYSVGKEEIKPTRHYSSIQENAVAEAVGGKRTPNSGATMFSKGDVKLDSLFLIECKTKVSPSQSISIKKDWLRKNKDESIFMGLDYSALAFNFGPNEENYYIIDEELFKLLNEYLKNNK